MSGGIAYAVACVVVPMAWGVVVVAVSNFLERRLSRRARGGSRGHRPGPPMYHI